MKFAIKSVESSDAGTQVVDSVDRAANLEEMVARLIRARPGATLVSSLPHGDSGRFLALVSGSPRAGVCLSHYDVVTHVYVKPG